MSAEQTMCYIGRKACGCITAVVVDAPESKKETAKSVAGFIAQGLTIDRVTAAAFRAGKFGCKHKDKRKQGKLL